VGRAFVVCRSAHTVSETDLLEHCRANLAKFKVPRSAVFVEALPKNDTGKINRQRLGGLR